MGEKQLPELYPGWRTVRKIGSGSFGTVYEIERDLFGIIEKAALKFITIPQNDGDVEEMYSNGYDDASITAHFETYLVNIVREYSMMVEMKGHTNVVYCDDIRYVPREDGIGWDITIKMELLTPLIKTLSPEFGEEQVIRLGKDLCRALALCKERDVVHRDIKPQNIFVSKTGDYKLGDFGIAKTVEQTTGGTKIGTYSYMAPEVYHNKPYGSGADIYSLGLVMYWLLNERRLPFLPLPPKSPTYDETETARHRRFMGENIPAPIKGSEALKKIVLKACAFDPQDRFPSAQEMLDALERIGQAEQVVNKVEVQEEAPQTLDEKILVWSRSVPEDTVADKTMGLFVTSRPAAQEPARKESPAVFKLEPVDSEKRETPVVTNPAPPMVNKPEPVFAPVVQQEKKAAQVFEVKPVAEEKKPEIRGEAASSVETPASRTIEVPKQAQQHSDEQPPRKNKLWIIGACAAAVLAVIGFVFYSMYHIWSDPTCTEPATCSICNKPQGEALGHRWVEADCVNEEYCSVCGEIGVAALGHSWKDADCVTAKTCVVCGEKDGAANGHSVSIDGDSTVGECSVCGVCIEYVYTKDRTIVGWTEYTKGPDGSIEEIRTFSNNELHLFPRNLCWKSEGKMRYWYHSPNDGSFQLCCVDDKVYFLYYEDVRSAQTDMLRKHLASVAREYVQYSNYVFGIDTVINLERDGQAIGQACYAFDTTGQLYIIIHNSSEFNRNPEDTIAVKTEIEIP